MKLLFYSIASLAILISCNSSKDDSQIDSSEQKSTEVSEDDPSTDDNEVNEETPDEWDEIHFTDLILQIEHIDMGWMDNEREYYDPSGDYVCQYKGIAYFDLYPDDWMDDKRMKVKGSDFEIIELYVQEVNEIGIDSKRLREVPFCLISNWKKSVSEWMPLDPDEAGFKFYYSDEVDTKPIPLELEELKNAIKNSCGEDWFDEFAEVESLDEMPVSEFVSQYNYKIVFRNTNSGDLVEKIIAFFTPTSC